MRKGSVCLGEWISASTADIMTVLGYLECMKTIQFGFSESGSGFKQLYSAQEHLPIRQESWVWKSAPPTAMKRRK